MTSSEIRRSFLDFFRGKEHKIVPGAPVVPHGDPTLLFTNAGMNQFKDVFLGVGSRDYKRAADTQKCLRVSGKHNDLEEVGVDTYHHTLFEMLGNWSFGDYYKAEAIEWAWELLTTIWKLPVERLHATVYRTDDEAFEIWKKFLPESRIHRFDEKDNFWEMGETGPCGPCSEIHFDRTPDLSGGPLVNAGVPEVIEIWNLVFIQYNRRADSTLEPLAQRHVDTGMGFERICAVIQGKSSNYDTDVFTPLLKDIEKLTGKKYSAELTDRTGIAMRVIADHARALTFAIGDGATPGNEGRSYVLRRILRRASRFARNLGVREPIIYKLVGVLCETMGDVFPEIVTQRDMIEKIIRGEEESFLATLDRGIERFEEIATREGKISGEDAFQLYDTFGFPLDLTELLAREKSLQVDTARFAELMTEQRERSRAARKSVRQEVELPMTEETTEFVGYETLACEAKAVFIQDNIIILDKTPFYAESGGQVSDMGTIIIAGSSYEVLDVKRSGAAIAHVCDREIDAELGAVAIAQVDEKRRRSIMRNHSATHLLHEALRKTLGERLQQAGSLVAPDYLRFDFNHYEKISDADLKTIENIVNEKILEAKPVDTKVMSLDEARSHGKIKMFFGDKYGERVRAVEMDPSFSIELCGGTHVRNTAEIGLFKIISESSIAAGVRRIEAVTGAGVLKEIERLENKIDDLKGELTEKNENVRELEKTLAAHKMAQMSAGADAWIAEAVSLNGLRIVAREVEADSLDALRTLGEDVRNKLGKGGAALLAMKQGEKAQILVAVTDDLKDKAPAGKLVGEAAKILGGGGGGKPHLATAGGRDLSKLPELLKEFPNLVERMLGN
ncbi:MAG: alanine--tRNA ligase [Chloroflexota bacterium]